MRKQKPFNWHQLEKRLREASATLNECRERFPSDRVHSMTHEDVAVLVDSLSGAYSSSLRTLVEFDKMRVRIGDDFSKRPSEGMVPRGFESHIALGCRRKRE